MKWTLLISIFFVTGCYINSNGCLVLPQSVHCFHSRTNFPYLAALQKPESLGHTNSEQRWKDAMLCGLKYGDDDINLTFRDINDPYSKIDTEGREKFYDCMYKKGYIGVYGECGYQEKPTGKCNL